MIRIEDLTLSRGGRDLIRDASLIIHPGQKVGLTGANGSGKSTLFALISKLISQDAGEVNIPERWTIASVAQEIKAGSQAAIEFVLDGDEELRTIEADIAAAEAADEGTALAQAHARYENIEGYHARHRAERLLQGLGFASAEYEQAVKDFSGGWQMRLNLARALMCRSDLLLLDEPTNHLDLDTVMWLEDWIQRYPGTLLLISHDRDFLDSSVDAIAHLEHQSLTLYTGNYAAFERQRAERQAQQQQAYEKQQAEREHMEDFVRRFRAKASKAKQAQSRLKALSRLPELAAVQADSPFHFAFPDPGRCANPLLQFDHVNLGYGDHSVLKDVGLNLSPGDMIGLLGLNGAGKSTLIKGLTGELGIQSGERRAADNLRVGYFAQHQLEHLDTEADAITHMLRRDPDMSDQEARNHLGGFGFSGDHAERPVGQFSGGERARLALALMVWSKPHVLLMDEPTNHLDLRMRDALTFALQDFPGALILVSHDRHLLRACCDDFWLVDDGKVDIFKGDLDDYRQWLSQKTAAQAQGDAPLGSQGNRQSAADRKEQKRLEAEARARKSPLLKEQRKLEQAIAKLEEKIEAIEAELGDSAIYEAENKARLTELLKSQGDLKNELDAQEETWMEITERLEAMD